MCGAPAMGLSRVTEQCGFEATYVAETGQPQIPLDRSFLAARLGIQEDSTTQQMWALSAFDSPVQRAPMCFSVHFLGWNQ